jgi:hypothetical protein
MQMTTSASAIRRNGKIGRRSPPLSSWCDIPARHTTPFGMLCENPGFTLKASKEFKRTAVDISEHNNARSPVQESEPQAPACQQKRLGNRSCRVDPPAWRYALPCFAQSACDRPRSCSDLIMPRPMQGMALLYWVNHCRMRALWSADTISP